MKKIIAILLTTVLILTVFAGCSSTTPSSAGKNTDSGKSGTDIDNGPKLSKDQKAILADLEKEFSVDGYEKEIADEIKTDEETTQIVDSLGITVDDYVSGIVKHYGWTFGDITVDGDTAVAAVTMTYPDFDKMGEILDAKADEWLEAQGGVEAVTEEQFYQAYGKIVMDILNSDEFPVLTADFNVDYIKDGKDWVIKDRDAVTDTMNEAQGAA